MIVDGLGKCDTYSQTRDLTLEFVIIIFHWLHLAPCLCLACQTPNWQTVFVLGRSQRTCIVCGQWYFFWVWNGLWAQSWFGKIPESVFCTPLAYLEKTFWFNWWMNSTIFKIDSVPNVKNAPWFGTQNWHFLKLCCLPTDCLKTSTDLWWDLASCVYGSYGCTFIIAANRRGSLVTLCKFSRIIIQ